MSLLIVKVESRPDITLNELKEQLSLKGVHISVSTIARCLEGKLITMKKLEQISINRNCEQLIATRREHATWLMSKHEMGTRFCYVDECGFAIQSTTQATTLNAFYHVLTVIAAKFQSTRKPNILHILF